MPDLVSLVRPFSPAGAAHLLCILALQGFFVPEALGVPRTADELAFPENGDPAILGRQLVDVPVDRWPTDSVLVAQIMTGPTPSLTGPTQPVNGTFQLEIDFGEAVTGFSARDLMPEGAGLTTLTGSAEDGSWTATFEPTISQGQITVTLAAGAVRDLAGNPSAEAEFTVTADFRPPRMSLRADDLPDRVRGTFAVLVDFGEAVTGFDLASELTLGNATAVHVPGIGDDSRTYRFNVTPIADGPVTVSVAAGVAEDLAGNPNPATQSPLTTIGDTTGPTPTISGPAGPVNGAFPIAIEFGEAVSGFEQGDLTPGNGTVSAFGGTGASYTAMITPTGDGPVTVDIAADAARDTAQAVLPAPDSTVAIGVMFAT